MPRLVSIVTTSALITLILLPFDGVPVDEERDEATLAFGVPFAFVDQDRSDSGRELPYDATYFPGDGASDWHPALVVLDLLLLAPLAWLLLAIARREWQPGRQGRAEWVLPGILLGFVAAVASGGLTLLILATFYLDDPDWRYALPGLVGALTVAALGGLLVRHRWLIAGRSTIIGSWIGGLVVTTLFGTLLGIPME